METQELELFHTSSSTIEKIEEDGSFGSFLFFASRPYYMGSGPRVIYKIELNSDDLIEAGSLFFHENASKLDGLVAEFCARFGVDEDTAEEMISEREQLVSDDAYDGWAVQHFTGRAAKILGYRGCIMRDEQGTVYMVDMQGHEADLVRVELSF